MNPKQMDPPPSVTTENGFALWVQASHPIAPACRKERSRTGKLSEVEALRSPYAHAITRWLGANADPVPSILEFPLSQAGYLILCSDGFWNYAAEPDRIAELCQMLSGAKILAACTIAQILVQYALSCGGRDNISVAVYYHDPSPNPV